MLGTCTVLQSGFGWVTQLGVAVAGFYKTGMVVFTLLKHALFIVCRALKRSVVEISVSAAI